MPVTLIADAHVNAARPTVNSGAISNLNVGGGYTGLMQFDLSLLPAGTTSAQISRAVLRLYVNQLATAGTITIQPITSSWNEYGVTYATLPTLGASAQTFSVTQAGAFVAIDVTALVQGWVAVPSSNQGLALSATSAVAQFDSKENDLTAHPAALDVQLASSGVAGPAGPAGATGPAGVQGPAGASGPQGVQGVAGQQGSAGPAGAQGAAGPVGITWRGPWSPQIIYAVADGVMYNGSGYVSVIPTNQGQNPAQIPQAWQLFAAAGAAGTTGPAGAAGPAGTAGAPGAMGATGSTGPQGASGAQGLTGPAGTTGLAGPAGPVGAPGTAGAPGAAGAQGPQGLQGITGSAGAQGPPGPPVSFRSAWSAGTSYAVGDAVSYSGSSYIAIAPANTGNPPPTSPGFWSLLAQQGASGPIGPAGANGSNGTQGIPGPAGPQGGQGVQGPAGAAGMNFRGPWNSGAGYAPADAVTYAGSTWLAGVASNAVAPGSDPTSWTLLAAAGSSGPTGASGPAASVAIGTVTTGAAGTTASVTNSGTGSAAVLNFTIPQGATGAAGSGGGAGGSGSGIYAAATYHAVSYAASFYSLSNPNQSAGETPAVLSWFPAGCSATQLAVFSQQAATITVTLRTGTPGNMAGTALTCQVATNQSCTSTGNVAVPAGSFADLEIDHPDSNPTAVWAAITCN